MVIAHLPAGYLLMKIMWPKSSSRAPLYAGLAGSIFPDFDLFYFYLMDDQQTFHHAYWMHLPFFWFSLACLVFLLCHRFGGAVLRWSCVAFFANIALHLCLDSIVVPLYWLRPFIADGFQLLTPEFTHLYDFWLWNYMLHPVFVLELAICFVALGLWAKRNHRLYIANTSLRYPHIKDHKDQRG